MPQPLQLNYYYGTEADQFNFYRIPKALFTDHRFHSISAEAKVLYGLMLDRMSLSLKNGWLDAESRIFIYFTLEDALELLGCGHGKAVKLFAELDNVKGIGLIERKKQGQGKPAKIYVKNFVLPPDTQTSEKRKSEPSPQPQTSDYEKSGLPESEFLHFQKSDANNTDINKTEYSDTEPSYLSAPPVEKRQRPQKGPDRIDRMEEMNIYREIIQENIEYQILLERHPFDQEGIEGLLELMVDVVTSQRKTIRLDQQDIPKEVVKSRFLKLRYEHVEYVLGRMSQNTTKVRNIRAYLLTALYHAPETMSSFYTAEVNHDLYGTP